MIDSRIPVLAAPDSGHASVLLSSATDPPLLHLDPETEKLNGQRKALNFAAMLHHVILNGCYSMS